MHPFLRALLAAALIAPAARGGAQITFANDSSLSTADSIRLHRFASRWSGTAAFAVMEPVGEFHRSVAQGYGFDADGAFRLDRRGWLSLRAALTSAGYGNERTRVPLLRSTGRILVDVVTDYSMLTMSFGPRIAVPGGPVRPYLAGGIGFTNFGTGSHIDGRDSDDNSFRTEHQSDTRLAWTGSTGFLVPLRVSGTPAQLDFGATYNGGGTAKFLVPGDIRENGDGTISFTEREGPTRFVVYRVGLRFGI